MPTLDWIGKKAVVNHHEQVPYRLLKCDPALSVGDPEAENLLVQGDNLLALKALLPYYSGQVKCIYIDPPYNTGNEGWVYNDNVNSPEINAWLQKVVGNEGEDLSRHDKWLCMMYPRLVLLKKYLREDGVIFISIDDNEVHHLRFITDEIFGANNFVAQIVWKKKTGSGSQIDMVFSEHEYVLIYLKNKSIKQKWRVMNSEDGNFKNPDDDERGAWESCAITAPSKNRNPNQLYQIEVFFNKQNHQVPDIQEGKEILLQFDYNQNTIVFRKLKDNAPIEQYYSLAENYARFVRRWAYIPDSMKKVFEQKRVYLNGGNLPRYKKFETEYEGKALKSIYYNDFSTQEGSQLVEDILGNDSFDYPKPVTLIKTLIKATTSEGDLILDGFAGTGTTGHATLAANEDDEKRKFILIEMDDDIVQNVTAIRLKNIITGYINKRTKEKIRGCGSGFRFCKLSEPLFDEYGNIKESVKFNDLAHHVYFSETGMPLPKNGKKGTPLIGIHNDIAYYLLFNGIMGDKSVSGGNILTSKILELFPKYKGQKIVYGEGCRLDKERLRKEKILFKQLPYELKVS